MCHKSYSMLAINLTCSLTAMFDFGSLNDSEGITRTHLDKNKKLQPFIYLNFEKVNCLLMNNIRKISRLQEPFNSLTEF